MKLSTRTLAAAADTLRGWALDEDLKQMVMADPALAAIAERIARRYIAGAWAADAIDVLRDNSARGHLGSVECVGESVRDAGVAARETEEILQLTDRVASGGLAATISFDLSHIGSVVSPQLGLDNALRIARAAHDAGTSVMISAEGSQRTDLVLDLWERISDRHPETGVTTQARLRRSPADLERMIRRPGPIRIVKGAFLETDDVAHPRDSEPMYDAYRSMADRLVRSGHRVNIATHDAVLVDDLRAELGEALRGTHVEFEMLQGLGTDLLDTLRVDGFTTREYVVYGPEWWLYVLNRIAEHPERAVSALADIGAS